MSVRSVALGTALMTALAAAVLFTSFVTSSAVSSEVSPMAIDRTIPNYMLRWDNSLLPPTPLTPVPSR